jgi:hypothetical protein
MWTFKCEDKNKDLDYLYFEINDLKFKNMRLQEKLDEIEHKPGYVNIESYRKMEHENLKARVYIGILERMLSTEDRENVHIAKEEFDSLYGIINCELNRQYDENKIVSRGGC